MKAELLAWREKVQVVQGGVISEQIVEEWRGAKHGYFGWIKGNKRDVVVQAEYLARAGKRKKGEATCRLPVPQVRAVAASPWGSRTRDALLQSAPSHVLRHTAGMENRGEKRTFIFCSLTLVLWGGAGQAGPGQGGLSKWPINFLLQYSSTQITHGNPAIFPLPFTKWDCQCWTAYQDKAFLLPGISFPARKPAGGATMFTPRSSTSAFLPRFSTPT